MNFWKDYIKPLLLLAGRVVQVWVKRRLRWAVRSSKNLGITVLACLALLVMVHSITSAGDDHPQRSAAATQSDENEITYREPVEAEKFTSATPAAPGATGTPSPAPTLTEHDQSKGGAKPSPSYAPKTIPNPTKPKANRNDKDATLKALASAYLSRGDSTQWKGWTRELTNEQLGEYLTDKDTKTPLAGRGKSQVKNIDISKGPFKNADRDTKVRYSRWITATVETEKGGTLKLTYDVVLMRGESGWQATDMKSTGWKVTKD